MEKITMRPDLRTAGGEVSDMMLSGRFVGTVSLVYRENERMTGSIQLEKRNLSGKSKERLIRFAENYVNSLANALNVKESDVVLTYSDYERIFSFAKQEDAFRKWTNNEAVDTDILEHDVLDRPKIVDVDPDDIEIMDMRKGQRTVVYELVIVGESRNRVEYHIYDDDKAWVAEAFMNIYGKDVVGEVNWVFDPTEDEIEAVMDLIVSDFDENRIETFSIDMKIGDDLIESVDLARDDLIEEFLDEHEEDEISDDEDYTVVMTRDDGDTLTYDIYRQSLGGLPIGTATVDISSRKVTGFIDFHEPGSGDDREAIAALVLREVDKERDCDSMNLTMLYNNEPIDEIFFESEHLH
ncbi:hypothetical protein [Ferviditalea candida]|uniref:Uncharacterized protein n=1 Tax=Ferviditalea candida TaxID=3108399 RepID=A0ABU5ZCH6_9BACL|nr:hypothetical protein [Paenibacillaceae bacterium T2]